jgi:hypothetical protein
VVEEEGVGGVPGEAGQPLVEVEGQPLRGAEHRIGGHDELSARIGLEHLK